VGIELGETGALRQHWEQLTGRSTRSSTGSSTGSGTGSNGRSSTRAELGLGPARTTGARARSSSSGRTRTARGEQRQLGEAWVPALGPSSVSTQLRGGPVGPRTGQPLGREELGAGRHSGMS
jgi:hypothetical protein